MDYSDEALLDYFFRVVFYNSLPNDGIVVSHVQL